jgi:hypothetical protein
MTGKERMTAALTFHEFDRIPVEALDCVGVPLDYPGWYLGGLPNEGVSYVDGWGCRWDTAEVGVCGEVRYHPLGDDWRGLADLTPPYAILDKVDFDAPSRFARAFPEKLVTAMWEPAMPNIFERMQHLRGTENLFLDLALGDERVIELRDKLWRYFRAQMVKWCETAVDLVHIHDDWGSQTSMLISPDLWREVFKPVYQDFVTIAKEHGKFVLFHCDGFIQPILEDLVEIGVDAVNSQIFCMPIEELADTFHHRLCFWGEIDRQYTQPFGTPDDMRAAARRLAAAFLKWGRTGFVGCGWWTMNTPEENKAAELDEWTRISDELGPLPA